MLKTKKVNLPHTVEDGKEYVSHEALLEYVKKQINRYEKAIDHELSCLEKDISVLNKEKIERQKRFIVDYCDTASDELCGILLMMLCTNCIKDTKYRWYKNYIGNNIRWRYDYTFRKLGL